MAPLIEQPFPVLQGGTVAPDPTEFWAPRIRRAPLPTNSPWQNLVLNKGSCPEYLHPYSFQSCDGRLSFCYPSRGPGPDFIFQIFVPDLCVSCRDAITPHAIVAFDDLTVTLQFGSTLRVPLARGSPYVTFLFTDGMPLISTIHGVLELHSDQHCTRHRLVLNNGQSWLIYASSPLPLEKNLRVSTSGGRFTGVLRIALLPPGGDGEDSLDRFSTAYPVGGDVDLMTEPFRPRFSWRKRGWGDLLMLSLPYHREILELRSYSQPRIVPSLSYASIDGAMEGVVGDHWVLREPRLDVSWYSLQGLGLGRPLPAPDDLRRALEADVKNLQPIFNASTYYHGKSLARAARLALIAEEVGRSGLVGEVREFLVRALTPWFRGTFEGNALVYDEKWGGVVSREGARDSGADFGLGLYNDHHFHYGYFCYAGAVLARLDPAWGAAFKSHLYALVRDYMNSDSADQFFPRLRCFDPWKLHSWAGGLTEFADGRNQESTSEAVNAYYAAALVGLAYGDSHVVNLGLTLTALEIRASRSLWHVKSNSEVYEAEFVKENRVVGVLWANKRDSGLWFASKDFREMRLGIQLLPVSPISEVLFQDEEFVQELVEWALPALNRGGVTDGWRGFVYALLAMYHPQKALRLVSQLAEHDDGNSLSNLLWWIHTRPKR